MLRIRSLILILTGLFLEVLFYFWRFYQDGIYWPIAIIIGVALTVLLLSLSKFWKNPLAWVFMIPLVFYSVYCTAAGQSFSLSSRILKNEMNIEQINEIKDSIENLKLRRKEKQDEINIIPLEKRSWTYYDIRIKDDEKEIKLYDFEIDKKQQLLNNQREKKLPGQNTYDHYSEITGIPAKFLQTFFSIILSVFIAIMAPFGINLWPDQIKEKKKDDDIPRWIAVSTAGSKNYFVSKDMVLAFLEKQKTPMTSSRYDALLTAACLAKCVEIKDDKIYPLINDEEEFEKRLRRCL